VLETIRGSFALDRERRPRGGHLRFERLADGGEIDELFDRLPVGETQGVLQFPHRVIRPINVARQQEEEEEHDGELLHAGGWGEGRRKGERKSGMPVFAKAAALCAARFWAEPGFIPILIRGHMVPPLRGGLA
jgi:hypothetical protein